MRLFSPPSTKTSFLSLPVTCQSLEIFISLLSTPPKLWRVLWVAVNFSEWRKETLASEKGPDTPVQTWLTPFVHPPLSPLHPGAPPPALLPESS